MCSLEGTLEASKVSIVDKESIIDELDRATERESDKKDHKTKNNRPQRLKITLSKRG